MLSQKLDAQSPFCLHIPPIGSFTWQLPAKLVMLQDWPDGQEATLQHAPSVQLPDVHWALSPHGAPFGWGVGVIVGVAVIVGVGV